MGQVQAIAAILLLAGCGNAAADPPSGKPQANGSEAAAASGPGDLAAVGRYRMRGSPDEVSGLELTPDGRFRFGLSAGALDLRAEGRWTSDGRTVILNTEPRPTPATFAAGPVTRDDGPLSILVNNPGGRGIASIDVKLGFADGTILDGYTQDYGWQPQEGASHGQPRWVELSLDMFEVPPRRFPIDPAAGNVFTFTFIPNDLGTYDFRDQALEIAPGQLVMLRGESRVTYVRED
jgi:hypothetical protein